MMWRPVATASIEATLGMASQSAVHQAGLISWSSIPRDKHQRMTVTILTLYQ